MVQAVSSASLFPVYVDDSCSSVAAWLSSARVVRCWEKEMAMARKWKRDRNEYGSQCRETSYDTLQLI
jgi:hypothetical protein